MVKRIFSLSAFLLIAFLFSACSPKHADLVVASFAGQEIKMPEFEKAYVKNAGSPEKAAKDSLSQYKNFLNLYVNFKLKLRDAAERGYEANKELADELLDYKKKVGVTYILEKQLVEPGIKVLYAQRKYEYRVSHLMIRPEGGNEDAAAALAQQLYDSLKLGVSFEDLVLRNSQDNFSKNNGGDIYWITAGMLIPEFENAVYATGVGKVYPKPVKTKYGYHLIKVTAMQERIPQIRASHILIDFYNDKGEVDSAGAWARADSVYKRVKAGEDFAELAKEYSEDSGTKNAGGDLNYFERRMMVKEFDEAAFGLTVGEISPIVRTNYGYHIIKLTDKKTYPAFEEDRENLKRLYRQVRYNYDNDTLLANLRKKYKYSLDQATLNFVVRAGDSTRVGPEYYKTAWRDSVKDNVLFTIGGVPTTVDSFFAQIENNPEYSSRLIDRQLIESAVSKKSGDMALDMEALVLDKQNQDFADLMDDYKNGIYIFRLQDEEVWGKIQLDSARLYAHYEKTKENYRWNDRVEIGEIFSYSDSLINLYHKRLQAGEIFDTLASQVTERPGFKEKAGRFSLLDVSSSQLHMEADKLRNLGDFSAPFANSGGYSIVRLYARDKARVKTFEEARAEVSGAFQEEESKRLENSYLDRLKEKYKPMLEYDNLEKAFKAE